VKREAQAAADAGLAVRFEDEAPLPFLTRAAARFDNQAQFNPRVYLDGLAARIPGGGSFIFDDTRVVNVREGEPCVVECENGSLTRFGRTSSRSRRPAIVRTVFSGTPPTRITTRDGRTRTRVRS